MNFPLKYFTASTSYSVFIYCDIRSWAVIGLIRIGSGTSTRVLLKFANKEKNPQIRDAMSAAIARRTAAQAGLFDARDFQKRNLKRERGRERELREAARWGTGSASTSAPGTLSKF